MKYLITLISMLYSVNSFSQTINPDLFQTWYLYSQGSSDSQEYYHVSAVTPSISPNITFTETLDIYGYGSCNSFTGNFSSPFGNLQFVNFASTQLLCESSEQTSYEEGFFSLMQFDNAEAFYSISGEGDDMSLYIGTPIFADYFFGNSQLHAPNFDFKQTIVYPNPVDSKLFVVSQNNLINKIEIFNSFGQNVKSINSGFDVIDTSDFASGIYLIKLYSAGKIISKKIMKK